MAKTASVISDLLLPTHRAHTRIHQAVDEVRGQVPCEHERRRHKGDAGEQGHVSPEAGRDGGLAETGIAEHLFHKHRAAEDLGDLGELERDGRERQIAQAVADERLAPREAAGPGEADVVAVQRTKRSSSRPSRRAAATPRTKPSTPEATHATPMRASELAAREAMTSATGAL